MKSKPKMASGYIHNLKNWRKNLNPWIYRNNFWQIVRKSWARIKLCEHYAHQQQWFESAINIIQLRWISLAMNNSKDTRLSWIHNSSIQKSTQHIKCDITQPRLSHQTNHISMCILLKQLKHTKDLDYGFFYMSVDLDL